TLSQTKWRNKDVTLHSSGQKAPVHSRFSIAALNAAAKPGCHKSPIDSQSRPHQARVTSARTTPARAWRTGSATLLLAGPRIAHATLARSPVVSPKPRPMGALLR